MRRISDRCLGQSVGGFPRPGISHTSVDVARGPDNPEPMLFEDFDTRGYHSVDVRTGYGEWVEHYDHTVQDAMDIALFDQLTTPNWTSTEHAVDLACGTGRTGAWLRQRGAGHIDGVDLTSGMLHEAQRRGAHDTLVEADVRDTGLPEDTYDLAVTSLADEHLDDLTPLYREAARITSGSALFVLVCVHPHFIMHTGMPTHYNTARGEPVAITTTVHLISDHVRAALDTGWQLAEMREGLIDDIWIAAKPKWAHHRNHPVSLAYVWRRG